MRNAPDLSAAKWRKSSYSNADGGACIEVADGYPGITPVRDSKNPQGPTLIFPAGTWSAFLTEVKAGHFSA